MLCLRETVVTARVTSNSTVAVYLERDCGLGPCNFTDLPLNVHDDPPVTLGGESSSRESGVGGGGWSIGLGSYQVRRSVSI